MNNNHIHQQVADIWRRQDSGSATPVEPTSDDTPTSSATTATTSTTAPVSSSTTTTPTSAQPAPSSATTAPTSSSRTTPVSSSTERTSSIVSSTSTSVSVVVVTSVETVSGSTRTLTSSSSSTALIPTSAAAQNGGGGGLSTTAKNGIIGAAAGVGGLLLLGGLFWFLTRCMRKRKSAYVPGEDEIRWPEAEQDSGALFAPAVRRTGGAGLGRETSMRSTTSGIPASITTAGYNPNATSMDGHNAAGFGAAAGMAGAGFGAGYYASQQPYSHQEEELGPNTRYSAYSQQGGYGGYPDNDPYGYEDPNAPRDTQDYQYEESIRSGRGQLRPTNYSNLDNIAER